MQAKLLNPRRIISRIETFKYPFIFLLALLVYINSVGHGFVYDDKLFIVENIFIKDWRNIFHIHSFIHHTWEDLDVNRPMMVISLILDFSIWKLNPMGYHLTNIIIHAANSVILLYLLSLILTANRTPFVSAMIFAVHPIHIQAVNAINFREDLLVTLFSLISLVFFVKGFAGSKKNFLLSLSFYVPALLSKETGLILPVIYMLYIRIWMPRDVPRWFFPSAFFITMTYLMFFIYIRQFSGGTVVTQWTLVERLYGSSVIFGRYLWLHLFPIGLTACYDEKFMFTFAFKNILSSSIMLILLTWLAYRLIGRPNHKYFFVGWFFIAMIPVTNIIPILNPIAERYLYLPSIGLITYISMEASELLEKNKKIGWTILLVLIVFFSALTINGNKVWRDNYSLWSDVIKKAPEDSIAHSQLGSFYVEKKLFNRAYTEYQAALKFAPDNPFFKASIHSSIGELYVKNKDEEKAFEEFKAALLLSPLYYEANINLGLLYMKNLMFDKALTEFQTALKLKPDSDVIYYHLGTLYVKTRQHDKAYWAYQKALELNPGNAKVYFSFGELLYEDSNLTASIAMFKKGLSLAPHNAWAHSFLDNIYKKMRNEEMP